MIGKNGNLAWSILDTDDPTIPFYCMCQIGMHRCTLRDETKMHMAAFSVLALNWKQTKCLSTIYWINKLWYIPTTEN